MARTTPAKGEKAMSESAVTPTEERDEKTVALLKDEKDLLDVLLGSAEQVKNSTEVIRIIRNGEVQFALRVRGVTEDEDRTARDRATDKKRTRKIGNLKVPFTDNVRYRSGLIQMATVAFCRQVGDPDPETGAVAFEDAENMWDNSDLRKQLNVTDKRDMVDRILKAGEKAQVMEVIERLSGFGLEPTEDDEEDVTLESEAGN
jgi:hypothetical protein